MDGGQSCGDNATRKHGTPSVMEGLAGPDPPAAVYFYSPDRKAKWPTAHLEGFQGVLQVDGYAGFETLAASGEVVLAACWAHARRKFYEFHQATGSPIAAEALRRIAELYAVEKRIRGQPAKARQRARQATSRPLVEAMKPWLETQLGRIPNRGGLAEAVRYALARPLRRGFFFLLTRTRPEPGNSSSLAHQRVRAVRVIRFDAHGRR